MSEQQQALNALRRQTQLGTIDMRAQMRDANQNFVMGRDEDERQLGRNKANLGQQMNSRGLGWSGIKTGAQGRQLEDFTSMRGQKTLAHQQDRDALRRAIQALRADAAVQEADIMSRGLS